MEKKCGAKTLKGGLCTHPAGWRTFHKGSGACHFHHKISIHRSEKLKDGSCTPKSIYEECALLELRDTRKVDKYIYEPFSIQYKSPFKGDPGFLSYKPDILVHYADGKRVIIEVKSTNEVWHSENLAKFKAASDYAKSDGCDFEVWVYDSMDKSINSYRDIADRGYRSTSNTWFALSKWVKDENRINLYWEEFAREIGEKRKIGSELTSNLSKVQQCWRQAIKQGFDSFIY